MYTETTRGIYYRIQVHDETDYTLVRIIYDSGRCGGDRGRKDADAGERWGAWVGGGDEEEQRWQ